MAPAPATANMGPAVIMVVGSDATFEVWQRRLSGTELGSRVAVIERSSAAQHPGHLGGAVLESEVRAKLPSGLTCDVDSVAFAAGSGLRPLDFILWNATRPSCMSTTGKDDVEADLAFQHEGFGRSAAVYFLLDVLPGAVDAEIPPGDEEQLRFADHVILSATDVLEDWERARVVERIQAMCEEVPITWADDEDLSALLQPTCAFEEYDSDDDGISTMSTDDEVAPGCDIPVCSPIELGHETVLRAAFLDSALGQGRRRRTLSA
mmetsp:Transcript_80218/g.232898  ORF Transcript_80218/g.232898 Transcript_80218/m.232898 type:complete len:264 (+) Transcript_80218:120-911(+)